MQTVPFPVYEALQVQVKSLVTPICWQSAFGSHGLGEHGSGAVTVISKLRYTLLHNIPGSYIQSYIHVTVVRIFDVQ